MLIAALLVFSLSGIVLAQSAPTLEERMTGSEFQSTGLDKLSPDELARLNAWLQKNSQPAGVAALPREDRRGFVGDGANRSTIVSRIVGEFRGWDGGTEFVLENGQVWQQKGSGVLAGVRLTNPTVTIEPALFSGWRLKVEGYNSFIEVRRSK